MEKFKFVVSIENSKISEYHIFSKKTLVLFTVCSEFRNEDGKIFKEKKLIYNQLKNKVEDNMSKNLD